VVVHKSLYPPGDWPAVEARLQQTAGLRFVHAEADGAIYEVLKGM
jgi:hypothetical protein